MDTSSAKSLSGDLAFKAPVIAATTANITLSGLQTVDGISVAEGDRVLVKDQTDTTQNGIYEAATGAWSRAPDFDGVGDAAFGTSMLVLFGTDNTGFWKVITNGPVIGQALSFGRFMGDAHCPIAYYNQGRAYNSITTYNVRNNFGIKTFQTSSPYNSSALYNTDRCVTSS